MARPVFKLLYPFEVPVLLYALVVFLIDRTHGLAIQWAGAFDPTYDLILLKEAGRYSLIAALGVYGVRRLRGTERDVILDDLRSAVGRFVGPWRDWRRWVELLRAILAIKVTLMLFSNLKQQIPFLNPVLYDDQLWVVDRVLHLGVSPTHASLAVLSPDWLTLPIDWVYALWYTIKIPFLVYFLFFAPTRRAWQFMTCYLLLWMIGGGIAAWLPSWGPCYTNPELFQGLDTPVASMLQARLWTGYQAALADPTGHAIKLYEGIAAFPSLHVGFAALFAASAWRWRRLRWVLIGFTALIQIGSVHLGWHYAVDGYFAIALVAVLWNGVGWLLPDEPWPDEAAPAEGDPSSAPAEGDPPPAPAEGDLPPAPAEGDAPLP